MDEESLKWYEKHWIIWVLTIFITPVGLFFMWRFSRYGMAVKVLATLIFGGNFLISFYDPPAKTNRPAQKEVKIEQHVDDLGITVDEFKKAFNENALARKVPQLVIKDITFGEVGSKNEYTFGYQFIQSFYLLGTVNKETGKIEKLAICKALVLNGDDRVAEMQATGAAFLIMVQTLSPDISKNERANILNTFNKNFRRYSEVVKGNIKYSQALVSNDKILMLSADPVDK